MPRRPAGTCHTTFRALIRHRFVEPSRRPRNVTPGQVFPADYEVGGGTSGLVSAESGRSRKHRSRFRVHDDGTPGNVAAETATRNASVVRSSSRLRPCAYIYGHRGGATICMIVTLILPDGGARTIDLG
jgi:hypothetical protein